MKLKIIKTIDNIKFPKIINYNNNYYIFGIVSQNVEKNMIQKNIYYLLQ